MKKTSKKLVTKTTRKPTIAELELQLAMKNKEIEMLREFNSLLKSLLPSGYYRYPWYSSGPWYSASTNDTQTMYTSNIKSYDTLCQNGGTSLDTTFSSTSTMQSDLESLRSIAKSTTTSDGNLPETV